MYHTNALRRWASVSQDVAASRLAVVLTIIFACVCIGFSWYLILVKSRMVRNAKTSTLYLLEACSVCLAYVAHLTLLHYVVTRRPNVPALSLSTRCVATVWGKRPTSSAAVATSDTDIVDADFEWDIKRKYAHGKEETDEAGTPNDGDGKSAYTGVVGFGQAASQELRDRGGNATAAASGVRGSRVRSPAGGGGGGAMPSVRGGTRGSKISAASKRCWTRGLYLAPLLVLVGAHVIVHKTIEAHHRQSQEIVLALVRCGFDGVAVLFFTCWCGLAVLRMCASQDPRAQRRWNRVRSAVVVGIVGLLLLLAGRTAYTIHSVDTIPHLRQCILSDHECDQCAAEGLQINPMMRESWVWPAITPRRLFTFYTGSEKCAPKGWHPIGYLDESQEALVVSSKCADGTVPRVYLHYPENSELHGRDDFFIVEVNSGNKQYHRDLEGMYGTAKKAKAKGVTVKRDAKTNLILSVEITPGTLQPQSRVPRTDAERRVRAWWPSEQVLVVQLGESAAYTVHCPAMDYEEYYMFPVQSNFQTEEAKQYIAAEENMDEVCDEEEQIRNEPAGNVLILLFDAVSRQAVRRSLPRFAAWMQDFSRRHGGGGGGADGHLVFEPEAQVTLGVSTAGNMVPYFAGSTPAVREATDENGVDMMKDLIHNLAKRKHGDTITTAMTIGYCHDYFEIMVGSRESSSGYGGKLQGVDHYMYQPMCHLQYSGLQSNFQGPYSIMKRCIDNRHVHEYLLNYTEYLLLRQMRQQAAIAEREKASKTGKGCIRRAPGKFFFDVSYFVDGHEGTHTAITLVDQGLVEFMDRLEKEMHFFDNPLNTLIFTADHGNHMGHYFEFTHAGQFERGSPAMLYIIHPEVFRRIDIRKGRLPGEAMANFGTRMKRATTPLDFYSTLGDLLGVDAHPYEPNMQAKLTPVSLFDARAGPPVKQCRDFSSRMELYICTYHLCVAKEDGAASVGNDY